MKKLIPFLFLLAQNALAQELIIRQDQRSADSSVNFEMLQTTDGYTPITGIVPVCTVKRPLGTAYASSTNTVTEIGNGTYQLVLSPQEIQNGGLLTLYCTGTGARARHVKVKVLEAGPYSDGSNFVVSPSNYNNTTYWTKTGTTATEDSTADYLGLTIGDTITGDGANSRHRVYQDVAKPEFSGLMYLTSEVKTGSLNNGWIGDDNYSLGIDLNTSTGAVATSTNGYLRGWKVDKLASSWWRVHILYNGAQTDSTGYRPTVALGNGTATGAQTFTTSGTMIFARTKFMRAEDVNPALISTILPNLASAASSTNVTLDVNETTSTDVYKNREICMEYGYISTALWKVQKYCSCITSYNGTTKVATLYPAIATTLSSSYKYKIGGVCMPNVNTETITAGAITATAIAADAIGASEIAADAIGNSEIAADAIGSSEIAASAITSSEFAQSAADKTWDTAPQDGSASTALGYLDAIKKYVSNKMTVVGSNYTIYKDDQTTSYATGTTNSAGRDPD